MIDSENKMSTSNNSKVLFIVFMVLKLTGNIDWSWWWVTSPLWIPIALIAFIIVLAAIFN